jgi:hypothetical protein
MPDPFERKPYATLEEVCALDGACIQAAALKSNIIDHNLAVATGLMRKINIAAKHASKFFPTPNTFDRTHKQTDLIEILKFMSEQIMSLSMYLVVARSSGIPVNINLDYFHRSIDRLLLMGSVISKDFHLLYEPRAHFDTIRDTPLAKFFGLLNTNAPCWKDEVDTNLVLRQYVRIGTEAGKSLVALDEKMTAYILSKAVQTGENPVGLWFARELDRILMKKGPAVDPDNELSVFAMAFRGYRWLIIEKINAPKVRKFLGTMGMLLANQNEVPKETLARFMYKIVGQYFVEDVAKPETEMKKIEARRKLESIHFKAVVEAEVAYVPPQVREEVDTTFTKIVRYARSRLPFGTPEMIFILAKQMYYSDQRSLYAKQALATEIILVPYVNATGAKQSPVRKSKPKGRKEEDLLRKVKRTTETKRKDGKVRFIPAAMK